MFASVENQDHPTLRGPGQGGAGNGWLLVFRLDDFDAALQRARTQVTVLEQAPQLNPATGTLEWTATTSW